MKLSVILRLKGTVILKIWWKVALVAIYTTGILCIQNFVGGVDLSVKFPDTSIPVLGLVTGLLLVFRTNTAYDRYWEGRKLWSTMTVNIRNLTRLVWVMVKENERAGQRLVEKISIINLLVAFAFATKNYLREEYSYEEDGLKELVSHLPKVSSTTSTNIMKTNQIDKPEVKVNFGKENHLKRRRSTRKSRTYNVKAFETSTPTNIPIEITYHIASYISSVGEEGLIDSPSLAAMNNALSNLVDCLGGFERVLRTPIPLAYSVHLHQATWLYLLVLPYQLIGSLNWITIPVTGMAAFALLGILWIGWEIENPFGYDENDLPLDDFCRVIHHEALRIIGYRVPIPESWLHSEGNYIFPFPPMSSYSASDLIKMTEKDVRKIICKASLIGTSKKIVRRRSNWKLISR